MACSLWLVVCSLRLVDFVRSRRDTCSLHLASNKAPSPSGRAGVGVLGAERAERSAPVHTSYFPHTSYKSVATRHVPRTTPAPNNPPPAASPPPPPVGGVEKRSVARGLWLVACGLWILSAAGRAPVACVLRPIMAPSPSGRAGVGVLALKRPNAQRRCLLLPTSYLLPPTSNNPPPTDPSPPTTYHALRIAYRPEQPPSSLRPPPPRGRFQSWPPDQAQRPPCFGLWIPACAGLRPAWLERRSDWESGLDAQFSRW